MGSEKIWPTRETVQITLGTGLQARDQLRAALADWGLDFQTVTEIPFDIELVGTGSAAEMFDSCAALTTVPDMDTSSVTNMDFMFYNCASLTSAPDLNTAQVIGTRYMFYGCSSLTYVPDMDTAQVIDARYMFYGCASLTDGNVRLIGRHRKVYTFAMIDGSSLTRRPFYNAAGNPI